MMPVVLAGPPAVADPGAEISARDAEDGVGPPGAEDLAVPGIVAEEAEPGGNYRKENSVTQLPPRVSDRGARRPADCESDGLKNRLLDGSNARAPERNVLYAPLGERRVFPRCAEGGYFACCNAG
jgi:hypothetical protein